ncbi:hypothetical protein [Microbacterium sp. SORGH_AS_0888]|uniref:hypothetical protein n=1 Tax=Microbacterium sp. SORGH_AS_0888 TaxID=3041791 RepID=UPI0027848F0E|nr:hypothetical protein [Microbacterium sp. SORGH_AS_0888]MDQ1130425.1 hypothetical protein [Microbacterium sp. SORGH_AS_0888]
MTTSRSRRGKRRRSSSRKPPVKYGTHWSVYLGVVLLALGVAVIAVAAILSR